METQTRGEKRSKNVPPPPLPLPPGRTSTRSAIKLDLSINIGESSARSRNPRVPVARKGGEGERASVPRRGPAGSPRGPPMNSGGGGRGGGEDRLRAFPNVSSAIPLRVPFALILIKPFLRTGFPW